MIKLKSGQTVMLEDGSKVKTVEGDALLEKSVKAPKKYEQKIIKLLEEYYVETGNVITSILISAVGIRGNRISVEGLELSVEEGSQFIKR